MFISYRRGVSWTLAVALYQHLTARHVPAFYDVKSIGAGEFDAVIMRELRARPYFVLLLTAGTLDSCLSSGDWVRREIEEALETNRVIIPMFTQSFSFDDFERFLPTAVAERVKRFQALELPQLWFDASVNRLVDEFLVRVPVDRASEGVARRPGLVEFSRQADALPEVTTQELVAQDRFERGLAKPESAPAAKIADFDAAIKLNPRHAHAYVNRAIARRDAGDPEGALADFDEAIRLNPLDARALRHRGLAQQANGELLRALADLSRAIELDPTDSTSFNYRGLALQQFGDVPKAMDDFSEAIRLQEFELERAPQRYEPDSAASPTASLNEPSRRHRRRLAGAPLSIASLVGVLSAGGAVVAVRAAFDSRGPGGTPSTVSVTTSSTAASNPTTSSSSSSSSSTPTTSAPSTATTVPVLLKITGYSQPLPVDGSVQLRLDAGGSTLTSTPAWTSADSTIATVDDNGLVTGRSAGRVEILATLKGTIVATTVEVQLPPHPSATLATAITDPPTAVSTTTTTSMPKTVTTPSTLPPTTSTTVIPP